MSRFESQPTSPAESCREAAPLLMELFDGEADATSAARARAHLLSCEKCAQAWLEWNQTQKILQSQPVPAPPPTLLWRIVLAARFGALKRRFFARPKQSNALGALYSAFEPHEAPATLREEILRATTRRPGAKPKPRLAWRMNLAMPALAAPAVATLLFLVTRETPTPEIREFAPRTATTAAAKTPRENRVLARTREIVQSNTKPFSRDSENAPAPREAVARRAQPAETPRLVREISAPRADFSRVRRTSNEIWERESAPAKPRREARLVVARDVEKPEESVRRRDVESPAASPIRLISTDSVPTTSANSASTLSVRETPSRIVAVAANEKMRADSRSSRPVVMPTLSASAPVSRATTVVAPARPRLVSRPAVSGRAGRLNPSRPNLAQPAVVLASTRSENEAWDDERLEEMQTVVAEFRAAFADEETEDELFDES